MIGQRHGDAVLQRGAWEGVVCGQGDLAIADQSERVAITVAPGINQAGLAMDEEADTGSGVIPAEADRRAAFWLVREVGWLAPFQGLFDRADTRGVRRRFEYQRAQRV